MESDRQKTAAEIFITFNYPELKDLGKHFLTISSATAVFLVTFVEKIVGQSASATNPTSLIGPFTKAALVALLTAVISAGIGLFTNYIAGAGAAGAIIWGAGKNFRAITVATYILYMIAGTCLLIAYAFIAFIGLLK